jgi:hypothetical protein
LFESIARFECRYVKVTSNAPASTQWDIVAVVGTNLAPAFEELIRQVAQGDLLHNDDTTVKILELMGQVHDQRRSQTTPRLVPISSGMTEH